MATEINPRTGHPASCTCPTCLSDEMDQVAKKNWGRTFSAGPNIPEPTRRKGNGFPGRAASPAKPISEKQIKFVRSLLRDRDTASVTLPIPTHDEVPEMSGRDAGKLIDQLLKAPRKPGAVRPATDRQLQCIKRDGTRLAHTGDAKDTVRRALSGGLVTFEEATATVGEMYAKDNPMTVVAVATIKPGLYEVEGRVYRVMKARTGTHLYAKLLDPETKIFEFESGAMAFIRPEHRMGVEAAEVLSLELGYCGICGRTITNSTSLKRGIGPICYAKQAG